MSDRQTYEAALALMAQYGDDAEVIAMLRAAEYAAVNDLDGLGQWDEILAVLADMRDAPTDLKQLN